MGIEGKRMKAFIAREGQPEWVEEKVTEKSTKTKQLQLDQKKKGVVSRSHFGSRTRSASLCWGGPVCVASDE